MSHSSDDMLNEGDLELLVKSAVMAAVENQEPPRSGAPDNMVVVGHGAKLAIRRAVMSSVKDLIGRNMLLAGPLKVAAEKTAKVSAQAEELWDTLKAFEKKVDDEIAAFERPAIEVEAVVVEAGKNGTALAETPRDEPKAAEPKAAEPQAAEAAKVEPKIEEPSAKVEEPSTKPELKPEPKEPKRKPAHGAEAKPPNEHMEDSGIVVGGVRVFFHKRQTPAPFKVFLRDFCAEIARGPVTPTWAMKLAQQHGWMVNLSTIVRTTENHIGHIVKKRDVHGKSTWHLPEGD